LVLAVNHLVDGQELCGVILGTVRIVNLSSILFTDSATVEHTMMIQS